MAFPPQGTDGDEVFYLSGTFTTLHDGYAYLDGSGGHDAISLTGGGSYYDYVFGGISGFEDLILGAGTWSFTLGGAAAQAFTDDHVVIDAWAADSVTIDGSGLTTDASLQALGSSGDDVLIGGSGTNGFSGRGGADTLLGGNGDDFFYFESLAQLQAATVYGEGGHNNIFIHQDTALTDADLSQVHRIDNIYLDGTGAQSATLGGVAWSVTDGEVVLWARYASSLTYDGRDYGGVAHVHTTVGADSFTFGSGSGAAAIYGFTTHGQADADHIRLLGYDATAVQAVLNSAVDASTGVYLYHDNTYVALMGVHKADLSVSDFLFA